MAKEMILRKRSRDGARVCTSYGASYPPCTFTFETCDELEATIKDSRGLTVAILTQDSPEITVYERGTYNACIEGIGLGTLYVEMTAPGPTPPGEDCCDKLNITGGTGISVVKEGDYNYTIINTSPGGGSDVNIVAGQNVQVNKNGNTYTISATDTIPDVNKQYVDEQIAANKTIVEAGANVTVTRNGNVYTVSSSGSGGGGALPVDFNIIGGQNVQVSKNGNTYTVSATDTITSVKQGTNTTVTKNGNEYTVNAVDTITTVKAGTNTTVTKNGNEYTVNAVDTDTKPVLLQELVATCDIGGIASGTRYPVGTTLEKILRDLLTCTTPPTPTKQYPWFTSEVVNRATAEERWIEFAVDPDAGTHTFDLAKTYEEIPVKFDVPADLAPLTLELYNEIFARWEVNTRDFTISNITRTIDGENVSYLRYTDAREVNGASRPVRMTWNP